MRPLRFFLISALAFISLPAPFIALAGEKDDPTPSSTITRWKTMIFGGIHK